MEESSDNKVIGFTDNNGYNSDINFIKLDEELLLPSI